MSTPYFYTNAGQQGSQLFIRGYRDGKRFLEKVNYKPYLFVQTKDNSKYKTIKGKNVERIDFSSMKDARDHVRAYADVDGYNLYGMTSWEYPYIYNEFSKGKPIEYDRNLIRIGIIDIETQMKGEDGRTSFPNIREADKRINAITIRFQKKNIVFGLKDYQANEDTIYYKCKDERDLLLEFISVISKLDLDVITAWNLAFDIPYITNRCERILGPNPTKFLSPWHLKPVRKEIFIKGIEHQHVAWTGISGLDYIEVYKKFRSAVQEMYKLDYIAELEIGAKKIDYSEYGDLDDLYEKNHQLYIDYNIHDCVLVDKIEEKLNLFDIQFSIAYRAGCNYLDAFATVKPWDCLTHAYLAQRNVVVPQNNFDQEYEGIEGAYVRDPEPGLHKWLVSFDYKSLYPSLTQQANISPETYIKTIEGVTVDKLFNYKLEGTALQKQLREVNASLCATGCVFDNSYEGFIPALMRQIYEERVSVKRKYNKAKKDLQTAKENGVTDLAQLESDVAKYNAAQHALKIVLNSGYGALSNKYFRWFDPRLSESITKTGQLALRWTERAVNKYLNELCKTENIKYVVYGDTDSNYIELNEWVKQNVKSQDIQVIVDKIEKFCEGPLQEIINQLNHELLTYLNHRRPVLDANREKIASSGFWTAKKRYALNVWDDEGTRYKEPQQEVKGLESIKNSVPRATRGLIKKTIQILLNKTEKELFEFIEQSRKEFSEKPFNEVAKTINTNGLAKYSGSSSLYIKGCPINTRGALVYNHLIRKLNLQSKYPLIEEGDKIKYCYLTLPNPAQSNVIAAPDELPPEFGLEQYIDYNTQFEKTFMDPIQTMATVINWKIEDTPNLEDLYE